MSISLAKQVNPENFAQRKKDNETFFIKPTGFKFIDDHFGFRPGKVHMFLGPTGGGKSSLVRTILNRMCTDLKVLMLGTEEDVEDLETTMSYSKEAINHENFFVVKEKEILDVTKSTRDYEAYVKQVEWELEIHKPDLFVFDNLTTSEMYAQNEDCLKFFIALKELFVKRNIPFIVVAHTTATIRNGDFFESSDIRGNRFCAIKSEYLYCLYRFVDECEGHVIYANFVYVDKSRTHDNIKTPYRIWFEKDIKQYTSDEKYSLDNFKKFKDTSRRKK